ncbi:MAG: AAA family ATPase [Pseudomonadota bacterium]|nr:AAA family ATPase [Pseudomonadota bacterium]
MTTGLIIGLIYRNETTKAQFGQIVTGLKAGFVALPFSLNGSLVGKVQESGCHALIVEGDEEGQDTSYIEALISELQDIPVYAAFHDPGVDVIRRLMRVGARDVIPVPPAEDDLKRELTRLKAGLAQDPEARKGKIVSIINSKSGSGATTVAVNVACDIAAMDEELKVALIDLDIQFGCVSLYLDVKWQANVMDALGQAARLDKTMLSAMMSRHDSGLYALPAPSKITRLDKVCAADVKKLIEVARQTFDVVILDLPKAINEWNEEVLKESDSIFLVIQRSLAILRDARLLVSYFHGAGIDDDKVTLLDNRYRSKHSAVTDKQISNTLKIETMLRIANDYDAVMGSQDHGMPLVVHAKHGRITKDIHQISETILEDVSGAKREQAGLLGRLIGRH